MKEIIKILLLIIILVVSIFILQFFIQPRDSLKINDMVFNVEIFDTNEEIRNGLSNRNEIKKKSRCAFLYLMNQDFILFIRKICIFLLMLFGLTTKKK